MKRSTILLIAEGVFILGIILAVYLSNIPEGSNGGYASRTASLDEGDNICHDVITDDSITVLRVEYTGGKTPVKFNSATIRFDGERSDVISMRHNYCDYFRIRPKTYGQTLVLRVEPTKKLPAGLFPDVEIVLARRKNDKIEIGMEVNCQRFTVGNGELGDLQISSFNDVRLTDLTTDSLAVTISQDAYPYVTMVRSTARRFRIDPMTTNLKIKGSDSCIGTISWRNVRDDDKTLAAQLDMSDFPDYGKIELTPESRGIKFIGYISSVEFDTQAEQSNENEEEQ
ncbi:MAG: hypothetical protein NC336_01665 [Clostridium sp.]|nr:hypothetical protein [Clostridium sp.]